MGRKEWAEKRRESVEKTRESAEKRLKIAALPGNPKDYSAGCVGTLREIRAACVGFLDGLDTAMDGGEQ